MNVIEVILSLKTASALTKLDDFIGKATRSLTSFASAAAAAYLSIEGLRKLDDAVSEAIDLEEAVGRLSQKTGLSIPLLAAFRERAAALNVPFDQLNISLGRFANNAYEAAEKGGPLALVFEKMGVSLKNTDGTLKNTDQLLSESAEWFKTHADGAQKAAYAQQLFGRSGRELIPVLNEGAAGIQAMRDTGGPITEEGVAQATEFNVKLRELKESFQLMFVQVANNILPTLIQMIDKFNEIETSTHFVEFAISFLTVAFKGLVTALSIAGLTFYDFGEAVYYVAKTMIFEFTVAVDVIKKEIDLLENTLLLAISHFNDLVIAAKASLQAIKAFQAGDVAGGVMYASVVASEAKKTLTGIVHTADASVKIVSDAINKIMEKQSEVGGKMVTDFIGHWIKLYGFVSSIWSGSAPSLRTHSGGAAQGDSEAMGPNNDDIKRAKELDDLNKSIYQMQAKLIQANPFTSEYEKAAQLIPLMNQQKDLIQFELDAATKQNLEADDADKKLETAREMVRLQGELADLAEKKLQLDTKTTAGGSWGASLGTLKSQWGDLATSLSSGAFKTIQSGISGMATALTSVIMGTKSASQAFAAFSASALSSLVTMITEAVLEAYVAIPILTALGVLSGGTTSTTGAAATIAALSAAAGAIPREFGGPVSAGQAYIVGERRPELFVPGVSGTIIPSLQSVGGGGGGGGVNIMAHFYDDPAALPRKMKENPGVHHLIVDVMRKNAHLVPARQA